VKRVAVVRRNAAACHASFMHAPVGEDFLPNR
jgi:hypothetical protein